MISTSDIIYPKNFLTPESRVGKTFKYYKIEPFELKKEEPPFRQPFFVLFPYEFIRK